MRSLIFFLRVFLNPPFCAHLSLPQVNSYHAYGQLFLGMSLLCPNPGTLNHILIDCLRNEMLLLQRFFILRQAIIFMDKNL